MIQYCLSYMWLFHERLSNDILKLSFEEQAARSGVSLMDKEGKAMEVQLKDLKKSDEMPAGKFHFRWRELSEKQKNSHDCHPAIDLVADAEMLEWLKKYLLKNEGMPQDVGEAELADFRLRITDFQFLNVFVLFQTNTTAIFEELVETKVKIIRSINPLVKQLEREMTVLEANHFTTRTEDYFGIPQKLSRNIIALCFDDMYQYDEPVFLTGEHTAEVEAVQEILGVESGQVNELGESTVHGINQEPPVFQFDREPGLTAAEISEYIEPLNLVLAERCANESTAQIFYSIVELIHEVNLIEKKKRSLQSAEEKEKLRQFDQFTEEDLRIIILKLALILDKCQVKRSSLSGWQNEYISIFRSNLNAGQVEAALETRERYKNYDRLLSIYLDEKDQQRQSKHSRKQEAILGIFTLLTVLSVFGDIKNFLEKPAYDTWNIQAHTLEFRLFLAVAIIVMFIGFVFVKNQGIGIIKRSKS